ncbi:hypothetical protein J3R83DRAFT_11172 [Lanmaoa asiatica]|nr:hypothetical protein J3R83DRAFT_11172 [Lanmaoa asiatica]
MLSLHKSTLVKFTRLTIETGLITTVAALLELILKIASKNYLYDVAVYANCLLASLNFRLVLGSPSDPSMTTIVWDDMTSNAQSTPLGYQPSHVVQILNRVESDLVMDISWNEAGPRKNTSIED